MLLLDGTALCGVVLSFIMEKEPIRNESGYTHEELTTYLNEINAQLWDVRDTEHSLVMTRAEVMNQLKEFPDGGNQPQV